VTARFAWTRGEQIAYTELGLRNAVSRVMRALGGYVDPFVEDDARDAGGDEMVAAFQILAEGLLCKHLADWRAGNVNERVDTAIVASDPSKRTGYQPRTRRVEETDAWRELDGAFSVEVNGNGPVEGDAWLHLITVQNLNFGAGIGAGMLIVYLTREGRGIR